MTRLQRLGYIALYMPVAYFLGSLGAILAGAIYGFSTLRQTHKQIQIEYAKAQASRRANFDPTTIADFWNHQ